MSLYYEKITEEAPITSDASNGAVCINMNMIIVQIVCTEPTKDDA